MHAMVLTWNGFDVKVGETVEFELKGKSRLQVTIVSVFLELCVSGVCSCIIMH